MKIIALADFHAYEWNNYIEIGSDGLTNRFKQQLSILKYIYQFIINDMKYCDGVFILGDLFERKKYVNSLILNNVMEQIYFISTLVPVYLLVGNHDFADSKGKNHKLEPFKYMENVHILDTVDNFHFCGCDIGHMPYVDHTLVDKLEFPKPADILLGHMGLAEAQKTRTYSSKEEWSVSDIPTSDFKEVLLGHYHIHQSIGNITYLGATAHYNWNDANRVGDGFWEIDFTDGVITKTRHPLNQTFQFKEVELSNIKSIENLPMSIIRINIKDTEMNDYHQAAEYLYKNGVYSVEPHIVEYDKKEIVQEIFQPRYNPMQVYLEQNNKTLFQQSQLYNKGQEILKKSNED